MDKTGTKTNGLSLSLSPSSSSEDANMESFNKSDSDDDSDDDEDDVNRAPSLVDRIDSDSDDDSDDDDDDDDVVELKQTSMNAFFSIQRKRGRPKKTHTASNVVPTPIAKKKSKTAVCAAAAVGAKLKTTTAAVVTAVVAKAKTKRINWSKGENKRKLDQAVEDWDGKKGDRLDGNGEVVGIDQFCNVVGMKKKYIPKACKSRPQ